MSNNDEYTPDFEVPSENDTSQLVSVQSEILDEVESSVGKSASEAESPPFSAGTGDKKKKPQQQPVSSPEDDDDDDEEEDEDCSSKSENKELQEIEDIIRKLERLEKAQTLLETALHVSDGEEGAADLPNISEKSERSLPTSKSSYKRSKNESSKLSKSAEPSPKLAQSDQEDFSEAINSGLDSIRQIIQRDVSSSKPFNQKRSRSPPSVSNSVSTSSKRAGSKSMKKGPPSKIDGAGDTFERSKQQESPFENVTKLKNEITRQEALIEAYQKENEKLYSQLKTIQEEIQGRENSHEQEVKDLKTEIATLKLNRLVTRPGSSSGNNSPRLGSSSHKGELDRLNEELTVKSLMVVELRKEIALLRVEKETKPVRKVKSPMLLHVDKEKEYQEKVKGLQKQVRTLQKILYSKETTTARATTTAAVSSSSSTTNVRVGSARGSLASRGRAMSLGKFDVAKRAVSTPNIDTEAIQKLEQKLEKERSEFQRQLSEKQTQIKEQESQINKLQQRISEGSKDFPDGASEAEAAILEQLQNRLLSQSEIIQSLKEQTNSLKNIERERDAYKREVGHCESRMKELQRKLNRAETMAKPSFRGSTGSKDMSKPTMNQEKEKDYQKQILNLNKQVRTLQKILYNKDTKGPAVPSTAPTSGNLSASNSREDLRANVTSTRPKSLGPFKKPAAPVSFGGVRSSYSAQVLESTFEQERMEFEKLLSQKQILIEDRDRQIRDLKAKLAATVEENAWITHESSTEKATFEEYRTKLITQNKIIESFKNRLAAYANAEAEKALLKREINHLEFRCQELQRKLARAENLARPENEVLATLSEKVEDLHTRYYYRERQLDTLLDRLSVKTGQAFGSPRSLNSHRPSFTSSTNGNGHHPHDYHHSSSMNHQASSARNNSNDFNLGDLSPSSTLHLIPHRDVPEI